MEEERWGKERKIHDVDVNRKLEYRKEKGRRGKKK